MSEIKDIPKRENARSYRTDIPIELLFWFMVELAILAQPLYFIARHQGLSFIFEAFLGNITTAAALIVALAFFSFLFGVPPIILLRQRLRLDGVRQAARVEAISKLPLKHAGHLGIEAESPISEAFTQAATEYLEPRDSVTSAILLSEIAEDVSTPIAYLLTLSRRSTKIAGDSLRRANIHLFAGVMIGIVGMVFFFVSTASDEWSKSFLSASKDIETLKAIPVWQLMSLNLAHSLPRITILVFVEVLAGFFLKQYRTAMEEFRYYESIAREREYVIASFLLNEKYPADKRFLDLSKHLLKPSLTGVLKKSETTSILESASKTDNEFLKVFQEARGLAQDLAVAQDKAKKKVTGK